MKKQRVLSVILVIFGAVLVSWSVSRWFSNSAFGIDGTVLMVCGLGFVVVGILIFVADLFETFLSHGQTALVDGLQAG